MDPSDLAILRCPLSGQPLQLETIERSEQGVEFGILRSEAAEYPIVAGIPVFTERRQAVLGWLNSGDLAGAVAEVAFGDRVHSRFEKLARYLPSGTGLPSRWLRPVVSRIDQTARGARVAAVQQGGDRLLRFGYLESQPAMTDAYHYFAYRFGLPRHLAGLAAIQLLPKGHGAVLDLGCGGGHLTWSLSQARSPSRVVGVDREFFLLLLARQLAPSATFVCADAERLPFAGECFTGIFSSDVISFVADKRSFVREIGRVATHDAPVLVTSAINRLTEHVYAGMPLSPAGYDALFGDLPHRLVPDDALITGYLNRRLPSFGSEWPGDELDGSPRVSIVASRDGGQFKDEVQWDDWLHATGKLTVNPLYRPVNTSTGFVTFRKELPSETYRRDNPELARYLPEDFTISRSLLDNLPEADRNDPELQELLQRWAILGLPDGYPLPEEASAR